MIEMKDFVSGIYLVMIVSHIMVVISCFRRLFIRSSHEHIMLVGMLQNLTDLKNPTDRFGFQSG